MQSSPKSPENQSSVSVPCANTIVPKSLRSNPVTVCFKSKRKRRLSSFTLADCFSITVPFEDEAVRGRMLGVLVGDCAWVWNGDQKVALESIVSTGLEPPK